MLQLAMFLRRAGVCSVLAMLLRWPTTRWTSQRCCDVRQRFNFGKRCSAAFLFIFFFFTRQLEERKKMGERKKFGHLLSSVLTSFVVAWSVVRNAKLPPTTPVATIVTRSFRQQQHKFQKHKKSVAFNMKQQGIKFF
jgi:hypothetical protein